LEKGRTVALPALRIRRGGAPPMRGASKLKGIEALPGIEKL
jgi:hypothetical protein